eukprot:scaffold21935_cov93-Cylindrotheca_fusiformis.AAC.1
MAASPSDILVRTYVLRLASLNICPVGLRRSRSAVLGPRTIVAHVTRGFTCSGTVTTVSDATSLVTFLLSA